MTSMQTLLVMILNYISNATIEDILEYNDIDDRFDDYCDSLGDLRGRYSNIILSKKIDNQ